jgi:WD40 repeat protein
MADEEPPPVDGSVAATGDGADIQEPTPITGAEEAGENAEGDDAAGVKPPSEVATTRLWLNWDSLERRVKRGKWIILTVSLDHSLKVWDLSSRECRGTLSGHVHEGAVRCASMDLTSRCCMSGSVDGTVGIWNMEECLSNDSYLSAQLGSQLCIDVDWNESVKSAITGTGTGNICLWDAKSCAPKGQIEAHPGTRVTAVAADFENNRAISAGQDGSVKLWDLQSLQCLSVFQGHGKAAVSCLVVNFDGRKAISGADDGSLFLIDLDDFESAERLDGHTDRINTVKVNWDKAQAVTGSEDDTIRFWDLSELSCLGTLEGHKRGIREVSVDFEEKVALSASDDCTLKLWSLSNFICQGTLEGHTDRVTCCKLRLERELACSCSLDGTVKVWDLDNMKEEDTFYGHSAGVIAMCA